MDRPNFFFAQIVTDMPNTINFKWTVCTGLEGTA